MQAGDRRETLRVLGLVDSADPESRRTLDALLLLDVGARAAPARDARPHQPRGPDPRGRGATPPPWRGWLPPGARVVRASEQAETVAQLTAAFELNLVALSLLALVVGMFLVYNTVLFSVVQRRAVFGTLRTLGTTPGQLFRLILARRC